MAQAGCEGPDPPATPSKAVPPTVIANLNSNLMSMSTPEAVKAIVSNLSSTRRTVGSLTPTNDGSVSDWTQCERADVRRKRLLFRCWHRGTQEGDLIFGRFAEAYLADFELAQLERFEALLDCTDPDLYDWIVAGIAPPEEYDHDVMSLLRAFAWHPKKRN